jgi:alpha-beta hydrolase superfamily lysophospholipase
VDESNVDESTFVLDASDGAKIFVYRWEADRQPPRAVVQIAHGASEHSARYRRVAEVLNGAGYSVYANDHRAHGRTAADFGRFGVARPGGWEAIVQDAHELTERIRRDHPGTPIVLFGHSMGSLITQAYLPRWGGELAGAVLSGSTTGVELDEDTQRAIEAMGTGEGADQPSEILAGMFSGFNTAFDGPSATGFEWLSRDAAEVRLYVDDPWCGEPLSNGYVADMLLALQSPWSPENASHLPAGLPLYVFSGDQDPVGGELGASVRELAERYRAQGVGPVTLRLYPEGRHEMLNETNRDEVHADLLAWLDTLAL